MRLSIVWVGCMLGACSQKGTELVQSPTPEATEVVLEGAIQKAFGIQVNSVKFANSEDFYTRLLQTLVVPFYDNMADAQIDGQYGLSEFGAGASVYIAPATDGRMYETVADGQSRFVVRMDGARIGDNYRVRAVIRIGLSKKERKYCFILQSTRDIRLQNDQKIIFTNFETILTEYQCTTSVGRLQLPATPPFMAATPAIVPTSVTPTATALPRGGIVQNTPVPTTPTAMPTNDQVYLPDARYERVVANGFVALDGKQVRVLAPIPQTEPFPFVGWVGDVYAWKQSTFITAEAVKSFVPVSTTSYAYQTDDEFVVVENNLETLRKPYGFQTHIQLSNNTVFSRVNSQYCVVSTDVCETVPVPSARYWMGSQILQSRRERFYLASSEAQKHTILLATREGGNWTVKKAEFESMDFMGVGAIQNVDVFAFTFAFTRVGTLVTSHKVFFSN